MSFKVQGTHWEILINYMENHKDFARGRISGPTGRETLRKLWQELALQLNAAGLGERPVEKWQKVFTFINIL